MTNSGLDGRRCHQFHCRQSQCPLRDFPGRRGPGRTQDRFGAAVGGRARRASAAIARRLPGTASRWKQDFTLRPTDGAQRFRDGALRTLLTAFLATLACRLAGARAAHRGQPRSAHAALAHVARGARQRRGHLGLEGGAEPVDRARVHLRDHARGDPAHRRAEHSRGAAARAEHAGDAAHLERILQRRARLRGRARHAEFLQQDPDPHRRPQRLFAAVLRHRVRHAGRPHGRHRSHRSHQRPGRDALGRERDERRHQHHHALGARHARRAAARGWRRRRECHRCALRRRRSARRAAFACTPRPSNATRPNSPNGDSADDDWNKVQAGFRFDTTRGKSAFTVQGDYQRAEQRFAGVRRRAVQRREPARPLGARRRARAHPAADVFRPRRSRPAAERHRVRHRHV